MSGGSHAQGSAFKPNPGTFFNPPVARAPEIQMDSPSDVGSDFAPRMRDRQSRGKDAYAPDDDSDLNPEPEDHYELQRRNDEFRYSRSQRPQPRPLSKPDFGAKERRQKAIAFLDNPEMLMMYAQSAGTSTTGARVHFMKMMCGYDDETLEETQKDPPRPRRDQKHHEQRDEDKRRGGDRAAGR